MRAATRAKIRLPDALVVACGMLAGCEAVVTNDEAWKSYLAPLFHQVGWVYQGDCL